MAEARVPAVSVVLPTHNRLRVLPRALDSVLRQSFTDFELIVVDDGSSDGTAEYLAQLADPRVRVLRQQPNRGAAAARNLGIAEARAPLLAFQDSDDEWLPERLALQLPLLQAGEADYVVGGYRTAAPGGDQVERSLPLERGDDPTAELLRGAPFVTPTWLVRRDKLRALRGFDESMPCLEDWDLAFRLADTCRVRAVAGPLLVKHGVGDNLFADTAKRLAGMEAMLQRHGHRWTAFPRRRAQFLADLGVLRVRHGRRADGLRALGQSLLAAPLAPDPWRGLARALLGSVRRRLGRR